MKIKIDPYHIWEPDRLWCCACRKSMYEIVVNNLLCGASRMFSAVLELGK